MLEIDNFWRTLFPLFAPDYEFVYMFLDLASIITFIKLALLLPSWLLFQSKGEFKW